MPINPSDTQPSLRRVQLAQEDDRPPRLLFWGVIILSLALLLGMVGSVLIFRDVLRPSQQQRVLEVAPFMRAFLQPTPMGGLLPTVDPALANSEAARNLLTMPLALHSPTPLPSSPTAPPATPTTAPSPTDAASSMVMPTQAELPQASPSPSPDTSPTTASLATMLPSTTSAPASQGSSDSFVPGAARIFGLVHHKQTWNNCGPATITTALSFYGWRQDQKYAEERLKPNREDKNVSPDELVRFVNQQTSVRALMRVGGSLETLKRLLANNIPVVIERGIMFEANEWLGHYQALVAYDDGPSVFYAYDSFMGTGTNGEGVVASYQKLDEDWRHFNRTFIVLYAPQEEDLVRQLLGPLWDEREAAEIALQTAQTEARFNPQDGHAWFNMGSSLVLLERYQEAANAFDQARRYSLPWRMLWYQFGPFVAYYETGRYDDVLSLAQINLNNAQELEETYYWRGRVYAAQGRREAAAAEYRRALAYNPNFQLARDALSQLG